MYSCLRFSGLLLRLCSPSSRISLPHCPLLPPHPRFLYPSFHSKDMHLIKCKYCPRNTITACSSSLAVCGLAQLDFPSQGISRLLPLLTPPPLFSFFQTVIPFFTSPYLVPTFHQLLVPPNSCHVDVEGLGTFHPRTLQMWLIKVEGGVGTGEGVEGGEGDRILHQAAPFRRDF